MTAPTQLVCTWHGDGGCKAPATRQILWREPGERWTLSGPYCREHGSRYLADQPTPDLEVKRVPV